MDDVAYVTGILSPTAPTSESNLTRLLTSNGWDQDRIQAAVNEAQSRNLIRWVAFEGWCKGGRPV